MSHKQKNSPADWVEEAFRQESARCAIGEWHYKVGVEVVRSAGRCGVIGS